MKRLWMKAFTLMMAVAMSLVFLPTAGMQAIAEEIQNFEKSTESEMNVVLQDMETEYNELKDSQPTEYEIIEEVVEKRTENQKEFLLSDGSFLIAVYGNAAP